MSTSNKERKKWASLSIADQDRVIRMAWEDRSTFESIHLQFGLTPNEVVKFMRSQLDTNSFRRWRRRTSEQGGLKHESLRTVNVARFKCSRQRLDGSTKGWK